MADRTSWRDRRIGTGHVAAFVAALAVVAGAAACAASAAKPAQSGPVVPSPASPYRRESVQIIDVDVRGKKVTCLYLDTGSSDEALSCDWVGAR